MSNQIELRHLASFKVLAEELHFHKAAAKLYLSQPGLSKQIKQLEEQLEVKLFDRNKKEVKLTPSGQYLQTQVVFLEHFLARTFQHLKNIEEGVEGEIRIGFVGSAMQNVIPNLIQKCNQSYPDIQFVLDEMSNQAQVAALQNHAIDLAFVRLNEVPSDLDLKPIFEDHFSLVLPKKHSITSQNFQGIHQFKEEPFILFSSDYSSTYYQNIMSIFTDANFEPKVSHKSIHANSIFRLVESGLGVAIVPHSLTLGRSAAIDIQVIELKTIAQRAVLSIAWKREMHHPVLRKVLTIIDITE
ncbi:MAG: LysR family transcriptional regulator [Bacteroidota bacterium]